jgi:hypothetical protein
VRACRIIVVSNAGFNGGVGEEGTQHTTMQITLLYCGLDWRLKVVLLHSALLLAQPGYCSRSSSPLVGGCSLHYPQPHQDCLVSNLCMIGTSPFKIILLNSAASLPSPYIALFPSPTRISSTLLFRPAKDRTCPHEGAAILQPAKRVYRVAGGAGNDMASKVMSRSLGRRSRIGLHESA